MPHHSRANLLAGRLITGIIARVQASATATANERPRKPLESGRSLAGNCQQSANFARHRPNLTATNLVARPLEKRPSSQVRVTSATMCLAHVALDALLLLAPLPHSAANSSVTNEMLIKYFALERPCASGTQAPSLSLRGRASSRALLETLGLGCESARFNIVCYLSGFPARTAICWRVADKTRRDATRPLESPTAQLARPPARSCLRTLSLSLSTWRCNFANLTSKTNEKPNGHLAIMTSETSPRQRDSSESRGIGATYKRTRRARGRKRSILNVLV